MRWVRLWVRWSWRDLRRRWVVVGAIALVIALGTGTYASLMSTSQWRRQSNDASFGLLHVHDLRVALTQGSSVPEGTLLGLLEEIPHASDVEGARERLIGGTQIAGPGGVLVPGEIVGTDVRPGPTVDGVSVSAGRSLAGTDDGRPTAVLEAAFARKNGLPTQGDLALSGGAGLRYVGLGQSPEYFLVSGGQGGLPFLSQSSYGVLFTSLHTAQSVTGNPGRVNDLVLTLRPGADRAGIQRELQQTLDGRQAPISATVSTRDDIDSYRVLYRDIGGDEQLWRVIALLVLLGATFAALNLTTRIVEAQRREIGIGMALGVPARLLALRPLLFGAQVALIGVLLGIIVGWLVAIPLRAVFVEMIPLPIWLTPFQVDVFGQAALVGFLLPFAAVAWPVWRAVRVQPVEAIRVGHLAARGGGLAPLLRRLPLPGRSYRQIPFRNLLRTPRHTALTALGIAAAITTLVTTLGFLDTFTATLDRSERELLHSAPDRITVSLDTFQPGDGSVLDSVRDLHEVAGVEPGLLVPVSASANGRVIDLLTQSVADDAAWTPSLVDGDRSGGLIIAATAADDLQVRVGDGLLVRHPRAGPTGIETAETTMRVAGIHPGPMRTLAYVDPQTATAFGFGASVNVLTVTPASGVSADTIRRALLGVPHVTSVQTAQAVTEGMRSSLEEFLGILQVAALVTLLLGLLIAFNTTSIGMDERVREHATMLAFGLPSRTVIAMTTVETVVVGALGTLLGVLGGYLVLHWMTATTIPDVLPEIEVTATLSGSTVVRVLVLGVLAVAVAPLLTVRRLWGMDIPSTLRVVE